MLSELLQALQEWRSPMKFLTCNSLLKYVINFHLYLCICDKLWMHSFRTLLSLPRSPEWGLRWIIRMQTQITHAVACKPTRSFSVEIPTSQQALKLPLLATSVKYVFDLWGLVHILHCLLQLCSRPVTQGRTHCYKMPAYSTTVTRTAFPSRMLHSVKFFWF